MSCNGCRILRKGCSETCILRPCLQWIDTTEAQAHATVFVAKFFGRAGLMSFISAVPENQRPALFQSLLFEAAGRTVSPVTGAVGLLSTGNWNVCQAAVGTVLRGGALKPIPEFLGGGPEHDDASDCSDIFKLEDPVVASRKKVQKRRRFPDAPTDLDLSLTAGFRPRKRILRRRSSDSAEESVMTMCGDHQPPAETKVLKLFS